MAQEIENLSVSTFLESVSAETSTPGGGAVAAITGAQAAALISMVCRFSGDEAQFIPISENADRARVAFLQLAEMDIQAFKLVMASYKQSKDTSNRQKNIQSALTQAIEAPRMMLKLAASLVESIFLLQSSGNSNLITDTGIAAILIEATIHSAELNILVNLKSILDNNYKQEVLAEIKTSKQDTIHLKRIAEEIRGTLTPGEPKP